MLIATQSRFIVVKRGSNPNTILSASMPIKIIPNRLCLNRYAFVFSISGFSNNLSQVRNRPVVFLILLKKFFSYQKYRMNLLPDKLFALV